MSDLLFIGAGGVRAYQAAVAATGDNVANADTPGFSRRVVRLEAPPAGSGGPTSLAAITGNGVRASSLTRSVDALKTAAARTAAGDHARLDARMDWLTRIEARLASGELDTRTAALFDSATDLAASPTSRAARGLFLDAASDAAAAFRQMGDDLAALARDLDQAVYLGANKVNDLTAALARTNEELRRTPPGGAQRVALLDVRDGLLAELARDVPVQVTEGASGAITLRLGGGPAAPVLLQETGAPVRVAARNGPSGPELVLDPTHSAQAVRLPLAGSLAGLLEARGELGRLQDDLDALATRLGTDLNLWHQAGADLAGQPGEALFRQFSLDVQPGPANIGTASPDLQLSDPNTADPGGYTLLADATGFTLTRADGGASVSGTSPLSLDGVTITLTPGARPGDTWTLSPVTGARALDVRLSDPVKLAAARPLLLTPAISNSPAARLDAVPDPLAAGFAGPLPVIIAITGSPPLPGTLDVIDPATDIVLASLPFTPGTPIAGDGYSFTVDGLTGDRFRIEPARPGSADNGNLLTLADVRARAFPEGTIEARLDTLNTQLASSLNQTRRLEQTAAAVADDAARVAAAGSAVDLDQEAAELVRLQMAYRANAQVISAARALFDTILGVVG